MRGDPGEPSNFFLAEIKMKRKKSEEPPMSPQKKSKEPAMSLRTEKCEEPPMRPPKKARSVQ